jgi:predicted amino acid dehydrogenase
MKAIDIWRAAVTIGDYRRGLRLISGHPRLDVVFICNVRDEAERRLFYKAGATPMCQENGPRVHLNGVAGQIRGINFTAEEMYSREGRKLAKQAFIKAVAWAQEQGAKVVLLAASTKRLFGRYGAELKALFPDMLFTIGDNGTAQLLNADVDRAIRVSGLKQPRVLVIGPYGILGSAVCQHLQQKGYPLIGFGSNAAYLQNFQQSTGIDVAFDWVDIGKVDLVVACTHSTEAKLTAEHIDLLRRAGQKLLVVDVAEPANLDRAEYRNCQDVVIRQDAGNGYSGDLHYVLGDITAQKLMLSRGTVFGCFAEAMALYHAVYREQQHVLLNQDWFEVSAFNQHLVAEAFHSLRIGLPEPHCFGQAVTDFNLSFAKDSTASALETRLC